MLVKNWMTRDVVTVAEDLSMLEASQVMREKKVRLLPVLSKNGELVGIVSDRDIKAASPSKATTLDMHELYYLLSKLKVKEVMTKKPYTIGPDDTVDKAAVYLLEKRISGLPVVDGGRLVGILTKGDVFRVLTSITGVYRGGVLLAFELEDRAGSIREVADEIRSAGGRMVSILTSYGNAPEGRRHVFYRVVDLRDDEFEALIETLKAKFKYLYHVKDELKGI
ncbi:MAG: CBS and ACT domain-containing protein [Thermodesulfobacteriota bacterium]